MNRKKLFSLFLALCMVLSLVPVQVWAEETTSGTVGENLTWSVEGGTLTISGTGSMGSRVSWSDPWPWADFNTSITAIVIEEGVTDIGESAFQYMRSLTDVRLPSTLTRIGASAFWGCNALGSISFPDSLTSIGRYAFASCGFSEVEISAYVTEIGEVAFGDCGQLTGIHVDAANAYYCSGTRGELFTKAMDQLIQVPAAITGEYTVPQSVNAIGRAAFSGCQNLERIYLSDNITDIDMQAFMGCSSLREIELPESLTTLYHETFHSCTSLAEIRIPAGVSYIPGNPFGGCTGLTALYVDEANAHYCTDGRGVVYSKDMTQLVFATCILRGEYTVPDSVTSVNSFAFNDCTGLTDITFGLAVETVGYGLFPWWNAALETITFRGHAPRFMEDSFSGLSAAAFYPAGDSTWTEDVRQNYGGEITWVSYTPGCIHSFEEVTVPPTCTEQGYTSHTCTLCGISYSGNFVPAIGHQFQDGVCALCGETAPTSGNFGTNLFWILLEDGTLVISGNGSMGDGWSWPWMPHKQEIQKIVISEGVTDIGGWAFQSCANVTQVQIPESVTRIGSYAFSHLGNLTSISIPAGVSQIEAGILAYCSNLSAIFVDPDNLRYCNDDSGVLYTKDMTHLVAAPGALRGSYTVPDSVTAIGSSAFQSCTNLTNIQLSNNLRSISANAFDSCSSLREIRIPASVSLIEAQAFSQCSSLYAILVDHANPNYCNDDSGVLYTKDMELLVCAPGALRGSYTIPDSVTTIEDWAFSCCTQLTEVAFGSNVTSIEWCAFLNCTGLTEVEIGPKVIYIGPQAFGQCYALTDVIIGANVAEIDVGAFSWCSRLETISFLGDAPEFGADVFYGVTADAYYPAGNTTWTGAMGNYGGTLTWNPSCFGNHDYNSVIVAPTCTEQGYTLHICMNCDHRSMDTYVPALGHDFQGGRCTRCGEEGEGGEPSHIPGDITGDGEVNNKDLTRLFRYLSGYQVVVVEAALDVTGDGAVNNKDLTRLFRYLSGFPVVIH